MLLFLSNDVRENRHDYQGACIVAGEKNRRIILNITGIERRHCLVEEVGDDRHKHEEDNVEQRYETGLDRQDRHVAGVDYPAGDEDEEYEEKLENVLVDVACARRLAVGYHQTDRAYRQRQSIDQVGKGLQPRSRSSRYACSLLSRQEYTERVSLHMTLYTDSPLDLYPSRRKRSSCD